MVKHHFSGPRVKAEIRQRLAVQERADRIARRREAKQMVDEVAIEPVDVPVDDEDDEHEHADDVDEDRDE